MKRLIAALLALSMITCAVFAQETETDEVETVSTETGSNWYDNVRVEVDLGIGVFTNRLEVRGAYMFPINDILRWDAGLELSYFMPAISILGALGSTSGQTNGINLIPFGSFWFWDFYVSYGLGLCISPDYGAFFAPCDLRVGWQKDFRKTEKGFLFKMEVGVLPIVDSVDVVLTLGGAYKFYTK